jgi:hypothetical protein
MGLASTATDAEVETAIASMKAAKDKAETDLAAEKLKVGKERAEMLVKNAVATKKIGASQEEAFITMATTNYDAVKTMLDGIAVPVMATSQLVPDTDTTKVTNDAGTGTAEDRSKWAIKDYMEKDGTALAEMAEKDPAKYRTLVSNAYPTVGKR